MRTWVGIVTMRITDISANIFAVSQQRVVAAARPRDPPQPAVSCDGTSVVGCPCRQLACGASFPHFLVEILCGARIVSTASAAPSSMRLSVITDICAACCSSQFMEAGGIRALAAMLDGDPTSLATVGAAAAVCNLAEGNYVCCAIINIEPHSCTDFGERACTCNAFAVPLHDVSLLSCVSTPWRCAAAGSWRAEAARFNARAHQ